MTRYEFDLFESLFIFCKRGWKDEYQRSILKKINIYDTTLKDYPMFEEARGIYLYNHEN